MRRLGCHDRFGNAPLMMALALSMMVIGVPAIAHAGEAARASDVFVDSMGTNIHAAFGGPFITNPQGVADALNDIGFRYARDIPTTPDRLNALTAAAPNVKLCIISQYYWFGTDAFDVQHFDDTWAQIKAVNKIAFLELPNEPQNFADYNDKLHTWTAALHQAAKADPVLASVPIIACGVYFPTPELSDLAPYLDYGNIHSYTDIVQARTRIANFSNDARSVVGNKPIIATETGYTNAYLMPSHYGVSEAASAKYLPRLYLEHFNAGIVKTFGFELIDEYADDSFTSEPAHYGLLRTDLSYKPAAVAMKNLIALLKDPGESFTPDSLDYALAAPAGAPEIHRTLLQKRDGSFWLALWQNVSSYDAQEHRDLTIDPVNVALSFNGIPLVHASTYVPNVSIESTGSVQAAQLVNVAVDDRVTLVELRLAQAGDTNADGRIDDADVATFLGHYGQNVNLEGGWALGDFDRDGKVGFGDFQMLELNYGRDFNPAQQVQMTSLGISVPEPGVALLLLLPAVLMRRYRSPSSTSDSSQRRVV